MFLEIILVKELNGESISREIMRWIGIGEFYLKVFKFNCLKINVMLKKIDLWDKFSLWIVSLWFVR